MPTTKKAQWFVSRLTGVLGPCVAALVAGMVLALCVGCGESSEPSMEGDAESVPRGDPAGSLVTGSPEEVLSGGPMRLLVEHDAAEATVVLTPAPEGGRIDIQVRLVIKAEEDSRLPFLAEYEYAPAQRLPSSAAPLELGAGDASHGPEQPSIYALEVPEGATWGHVQRGEADLSLVRRLGAPDEAR